MEDEELLMMKSLADAHDINTYCENCDFKKGCTRDRLKCGYIKHQFNLP